MKSLAQKAFLLLLPPWQGQAGTGCVSMVREGRGLSLGPLSFSPGAVGKPSHPRVPGISVVGEGVGLEEGVSDSGTRWSDMNLGVCL